MSILDPIRDAVTAATNVVAGAIALLNDLHSRLQQALADDDQEAVQEIADALGEQTEALAAAIAANTVAAPAEPTTPEEPTPPEAGEPTLSEGGPATSADEPVE